MNTGRVYKVKRLAEVDAEFYEGLGYFTTLIQTVHGWVIELGLIDELEDVYD